MKYYLFSSQVKSIYVAFRSPAQSAGPVGGAHYISSKD